MKLNKFIKKITRHVKFSVTGDFYSEMKEKQENEKYKVRRKTDYNDNRKGLR